MGIKKCNSNSYQYIDRITLNFVLSMLLFLDDNKELYNSINDLFVDIVTEEERVNTIITEIKIPKKLYEEIQSYKEYLQNLLLRARQ